MECDILFLDRADLATVVAADDPCDVLIQMIIDHDGQRVVCITGTLTFVEVPFTWFRRQAHSAAPDPGSGHVFTPNFRKARLTCLGEIVYFGEYYIDSATIFGSLNHGVSYA